ncbi:MAG: hypothetical protein RL609_970 [Bacteroidota bacterium]|jgi:gliding motility-associated-like protein
MNLKLPLLALIGFAPAFAFSQVNMSNTPLNTCAEILTDDGGGSQYTATDYTMVICPDTPGDVIQLDFSAFALQTNANASNSDYLTIYDGNTIGATSLGSYTGTQLQGYQVTGSVNNTSGCLTLQFNDNGPANVSSPGFEAAVSCTTPCANPTSVSSFVGATILDPIDNPHINVCIGESVTFNGSASFAAPGFNLVEYQWDFDDGTIDNTSGATVTYDFTEPGEHLVTLIVTDNNGCQNLNIEPLSVWVSTVPVFTQLTENAPAMTCIGDDLQVEGAFESIQWTSLPPQVVSGQSYLADGAGFSYSNSITYDFFDPLATLTDCNDLYGIFVNMEHSYSGDVSLTITCPNGTVVDLVTYPSGGGGTYLGEAVDDGVSATNPGVGYTYTWAPNTTNPTWNGAFTAGVAGGNIVQGVGNPSANALAPGTYAATGNLCDLVGCPLNGSWTISVLDNLAADNGYIFQWGLNLNPALFPGITTFTPSIGIDSDSSYWTVDPALSLLVDGTTNSDVLEINPPAAGTYGFTYHVINSFGCANDTTIYIEFYDPIPVIAVPDVIQYDCAPVQLQAWFEGIPICPVCSDGILGDNDGNGIYDNNVLYSEVLCPPAGSGYQVSVQVSGQIEMGFDAVGIYNGSVNLGTPLPTGLPAGPNNIFNWGQGSTSGLPFQITTPVTVTSTDPSGCLTVYMESDGSVGYALPFVVNMFDPATGTTLSSQGPDYDWEWTPAANLDDAFIIDPTVNSINQTTTFTVSGYPAGHPGCATSATVTVQVNPLGDPGISTTPPVYCYNDNTTYNVFDLLDGNPVQNLGIWTLPDGSQFGDNAGELTTDLTFNPSTSAPGVYTHTVVSGGCSLSATVTIQESTPVAITTTGDSEICWYDLIDAEVLTTTGGLTPVSYAWSFEGNPIGFSEDVLNYDPASSGQFCVDATDACNDVASNCFQLTVRPKVPVEISATPQQACWPDPLALELETDPTLYDLNHWEISNGDGYDNLVNINQTFDNPGTYHVEVLLIDDLGCQYDSTFTNYLTSFAPPTAGWMTQEDEVDSFDPTFHFNNMSEGNIADYNWTFDLNGNEEYSIEFEPVHTFPLGVGGDYTVQLQVVDVNGCIDVATGEVHVIEPFLFYIPTGFTPNGDNINDAIQFVSNDLDEKNFNLTIFDRWGSIVFQTTDPTEAWRGNVQEGQYFVPNGVYNWNATIRSKSTGERKEIVGTITIAR